jgi:glycosyltransferase involved in cell wall biosynthesis
VKVAFITTDNRDSFREHDKPEPWFGTAPEALLQGFARLPELEVHVISCTQAPLRSPARLAANVHFHSLHVPRLGWMRTGYQGCIRAVRRLVRELRPDVVHGQGTERECAMCAVFSGRPALLTLHGHMASIARSLRARPFSYHWLAARLENFALHRATGVMCNSEWTESLVQSRARQTWRVANAVRDAFFDTPPPAGGQSPPVLLNIGDVVPHKRQLEVLALCRDLRAAGCDVRLQFVSRSRGTGEYAAEFARQLQVAEREGWAQWLGPKSTDELLACCDIVGALVHWPTEESFGLVVAEALARNLKVFVARTGGLLDVTANADGAELFAADDRTGLQAAISRWLAAGAPRPTHAAAVMRGRFHADVIARQHLEIYRGLLKTSS